MPLGFYSLDARIQLARRARYSLDVQYYLIQNDRTGRLLMRNKQYEKACDWLKQCIDQGYAIISSAAHCAFYLYFSALS